MSPTFRERYCQYWRISPEQFEEHLFRRALYFHAKPLVGLLLLIWPDYFLVDREFVRSVGHIRSRRLFHAEAGEFHGESSNLRFARRWLRLRVSAERTRVFMEECWGDRDSAAPTAAPLNSR